MSNQKSLPIGIQTLFKIIKEGYYYVDKTRIIYDLIKKGQVYFLSRPRRFGKSLLVDTLKEIFEGNRELFKGLWIENRWNWEEKYPVIKISFGSGTLSAKELMNKLDFIIEELSREHKIELIAKNFQDRFQELIIKLQEKYQQKVVVLIDEYDKPILDKITDIKGAEEIKNVLRNFYGVLKDSDAYIRFVFLTGVTKFSKVSLFSGLNNLEDISLNPDFGEICGITEQEIKDNFQEYLTDVDFEKLREWYNGFNFLGKNKVYNPFDLLLYLKNKEFRNYWFETATPTFLIKKLKEKQYFVPHIENIQTGTEIIGSFDIENLSLETLLFQTGYVTIKEVKKFGNEEVYYLSYPNLEIKKSLNDHILSSFIDDKTVKQAHKIEIYQYLEKADLEGFGKFIPKIYATIPYNWIQSNFAHYEGYYCIVLYCYLTGMGLDVTAEDVTNKGRIDLTVKLGNNMYILEFKTEKAGKKPLEQIKERKYWEKYMVSEKLKVKSEKRKVKSEKLKVKSEEKTLTSDSSFKKRENKENVTGDNHRNQDDRKGRPYNLQPETDNLKPATCNLFLIGIEFDEKQRNVTSFEWERV